MTKLTIEINKDELFAITGSLIHSGVPEHKELASKINLQVINQTDKLQELFL